MTRRTSPFTAIREGAEPVSAPEESGAPHPFGRREDAYGNGSRRR